MLMKRAVARLAVGASLLVAGAAMSAFAHADGGPFCDGGRERSGYGEQRWDHRWKNRHHWGEHHYGYGRYDGRHRDRSFGRMHDGYDDSADMHYAPARAHSRPDEAVRVIVRERW